MADSKKSQGKAQTLSHVLDRGSPEPQTSRRQKRMAQHQHWMRVMMEGQATPDLTYQKPKI